MLRDMDDTGLGRAIRILRQRRSWRQVDLADRAGLGRSVISDIERGRAARHTIQTTRTILRALGAEITIGVRWGGPGDLDRLLDRDHAALVRAWAELNEAHGWEVWPEASYSVYGERGRVDLMAFHAATGVLQVAEMKTGVWDVQETLGRLDTKIRLAPRIAGERGWVVRRIVGALVIAEGRTARRRIEEHAVLFRRYAARSTRAKAFIACPTDDVTGILAFLSLPHSAQRGLRRAGQRRVRRPGA